MPSTLALTAESVALAQPNQRPRPRIESLTDLVFGLALSIGAISLISNKPTNPGYLYQAIAAFGFSFLILIQIWFRFTEIMSVLPVETTRTRILNTHPPLPRRSRTVLVQHKPLLRRFANRPALRRCFNHLRLRHSLHLCHPSSVYKHSRNRGETSSA